MAIEILRPNAAGDESGILLQSGCSAPPNHYTCVDEEISDGDSTHVYAGYSQTLYQDLYNLNNPSGSGSINHITVCARAGYGGPGSGKRRRISLVVKSGGTIDVGDVQTVSTTQFNLFSQQWSTNPNTGIPWTWGELSLLQAGVALTGDAPDTIIRCTQVYVEIDYTPGITHNGAATLSGVGTLAGIPHAISAGQSTLSGIGSLSAIGLIWGRIYGSATLSGIGNLGVSSVLNMRATASLAGAGSMAAAAMRIRTGSVILVGTGLLVIRGRITFLIEPDSLGFFDTEADGIVVAPYYLGNTIPLIFTVSEGGVALSPSSVTIRIVKPDNTVDETSEAIITNDEVECLVPTSITDEAGTYQVYFKMNLPNYLVRTHKMTFEVLNNR